MQVTDEPEPLHRTTIVDYQNRETIDRMLKRGWTNIGGCHWARTRERTQMAHKDERSAYFPNLADGCIRGELLTLTHPILADTSTLLANDKDADVRRFSIAPPRSQSQIDAQVLRSYVSWWLGEPTFLVARLTQDGPPGGVDRRTPPCPKRSSRRWLCDDGRQPRPRIRENRT